MKSEIHVNEFVKTILGYIFYEKIRELEKQSGKTLVYSTQNQLQIMNENILELIQTNPYSFFEVIVLENKCEDIINAKLSIKVKNFKHFQENRNPRHYVIVINDNWSDFKIYQKSLSGEFLIEKPIKIEMKEVTL